MPTPTAAPVRVEPTGPPSQTPEAAMRALGFDPTPVQTVIITAGAAVGIAIDYPEPYIPPEA